MTHTYNITGMTCQSCEATIKNSLLAIPHITDVEVSKEKQTATISMDKHIALSTLKGAINGKYSITALQHNEREEQAKSWLATYKPILLIFFYITTIALITTVQQGVFNWMHAMNIFMAAFFLTFSFFKMLDLKGFAASYSMYDIVAAKISSWGYIYAFIELALGIAYATGVMPLLTNIVTLIVMGISIIGVLKSVLNKRTIKCACLGAVFNLPMSTVTIVEDGMMIAMSAVMIFVVA